LRAAEAAACPPDYVAVPLLATASALVGDARRAQATPGWAEPPHLWLGAIGDSGTGKSPGADCILGEVLPEIERRMLADFPDRLREWTFTTELGKAATQRWRRELRKAEETGAPAPSSPPMFALAEPQAPRLRQNDVTIEKVAELLDAAAPKGLLVVRDELAGWIAGMNAYRGGGREFWLEAYGGRPYRVERKTDPRPLIVSRLAVSVYGGVQPEKLRPLLHGIDDGLLARILWAWSQPLPFRLSRRSPGTAWAIGALDRLRELDLQPGDPPAPLMVPLTHQALAMIEAFGCRMQHRQAMSQGPLRSASGKARGQALRLALVIEMLWWCGEESMSPPPARVSARAFDAAACLVSDYFMGMAERVYGDVAEPRIDRDTATPARWILKTRPTEVHVRHLQREGHLQREERLPGLRNAAQIRSAAERLVALNWLHPPTSNSRFGRRGQLAYPVNPFLWEQIDPTPCVAGDRGTQNTRRLTRPNNAQVQDLGGVTRTVDSICGRSPTATVQG
jgi:hypothetical protein